MGGASPSLGEPKLMGGGLAEALTHGRRLVRDLGGILLKITSRYILSHPLAKKTDPVVFPQVAEKLRPLLPGQGAQALAFLGTGVMIAYLKPIVITIIIITIVTRRQDV